LAVLQLPQQQRPAACPAAQQSHHQRAHHHSTAPAVFQQLEVDYTIGRPRPDVWSTKAQQVPVVRMYGVNDAGERTD